MCFGLISAEATVETGWPVGTPNSCKNSTDGFMDFELGSEEAEIQTTIPGLEFTTTEGVNWRYADIRTGKYNVPTYAVNGNFNAWLGVTGDVGRITFTGGTASYVSVLVSTYSGVTLDAYDVDGNLLANSGWATDNTNTGTFTRLTVEAEGMAYVEIHDTGNYWVMDDLCTDAPPACLPVPDRTIGDHEERIDLIFVPDDDYNGDIDAFLDDVAGKVDNRLGGVAPVDTNLDRFNFYYTELEGAVSSDNCGTEDSLPENLLSMCPYADAVVVLHTDEFGDCNRNSGAVGIFSAEGSTDRSFIHEGGHGIFGLRDEYDSDREVGSCNYTRYNTSRPLPSNIWETEADCRDEAQDQGWNQDQCYEFTSCQDNWWKLGDSSLADDDERYNDANFRFIMFDGNYFSNGFGDAAERRISWVFDQLPITPEPPLPSPSSEKSIVLELNIGDSGLTLQDSGFITDAPPEYLPGEYSLTAKMFSTGGNLLGEYGFTDPRIVQAELGYTGPLTLSSANFTLILPYFNNVGQANIVDTKTGQLLLSVDVSDFATGDNNSPIANAGFDQTLTCGGPAGITTILDGTGSSDPDGDPLTYFWSAPGITFDDPTSPTPTATFPTGTTTVTLIVNDGTADSIPDTVDITVQADTTPPELTFSVSPEMLWPPNHKMVPITLTVSVTDDCSTSPEVSLVSITMNEGEETDTFDSTYDDTQGDGHTFDDIQVIDGTIYLRAERAGTGSGRVYTIKYKAIDDSDNVAEKTAIVTVPHNQ